MGYMFMMWAPAEIIFEIEEGADGQVAIIVIGTPAGEIKILAELHESGNELRLVRTHIQSSIAPNTLGVGRLRAIADAVMERMGYDAIEIEGADRTTGAGPGRTPGGIRFARRRGPAANDGSQER